MMQLTHGEKTAIIIAVLQTLKIEDGRLEERTIQLMDLQSKLGVTMLDIQLEMSRGDNFCITLQCMQEDKKLLMFQYLCIFLLGKDGKFSKDAQSILLSVCRSAHMSDGLMQIGLNKFRELMSNR